MPNQSDMKVITTLTKDQFNLFKSLGLIIDNEYFHLPQYFKNLGAGEFEVINFEDLSEDVKLTIEAIKFVKEKRKELSETNNGLMPEIFQH